MVLRLLKIFSYAITYNYIQKTQNLNRKATSCYLRLTINIIDIYLQLLYFHNRERICTYVYVTI